MAKIYGFTLLRNGIKYDYSFRECLLALSQLVEKIYIAVGESDDGTREALEEFDFLEIIDTKWDPEMMGDGGQILSHQTNIALKKLKEDHGHEADAWGFYLQCDELIHERDLDQIRKDIESAQKMNHDSVRFRYLHFWKDHYHVAISKRWYPQEVRCVKLNKDIWSFGDAQGFSAIENPYESDIHIYHYGHVRDAEKLAEKQELLTRMIRPAESFQKYFSREKKAFSKTKYIPLLETHPVLMKDRIEKMGEISKLKKMDIIYIVGIKKTLNQKVISRINAKKIFFVNSPEQVPFEFRFKSMIILKPTPLEAFVYKSTTPKAFESKLAREWSIDIRLRFQLSEIGVSLN